MPTDLQHIDLQLLRTFLVLIQERSVSRAGVQLNLSQPTMSHALARLRKLFNDPLLLNRYGAMTPTARALEIFVEIEDLLARFDRLVESPEEFDLRTSQISFSVMAPEFASNLIATPLFKRLEKEAPNVKCEFVGGDPVRAFEVLEAGVTDFRLGWWPDPEPVLRHRLLWSEKLVCILRHGHPLLAKSLTDKDYFEASHIRVKRLGRSFSMSDIDAAASRAGRKVAVNAWVPNAWTMANVVAQTDLIGTMSERLVASFPGIGLKSVPLPFKIPDLKVALYWHERTHRNAAHRWFRKLLSEISV
jgi:DNA-binding transcriptional LysR family regulator